MKFIARRSRSEQLLIAAFLGLAAVAASAVTSIGHPETQLTEKSRAQPAEAHAQAPADANRLRMTRLR
jgi:hypothetical protein